MEEGERALVCVDRRGLYSILLVVVGRWAWGARRVESEYRASPESVPTEMPEPSKRRLKLLAEGEES